MFTRLEFCRYLSQQEAPVVCWEGEMLAVVFSCFFLIIQPFKVIYVTNTLLIRFDIL